MNKKRKKRRIKAVTNGDKNMVKRIQVYGGCLWSRKTKKDAVSCEKPGSGANIHLPPDIRME